jgi:hypothetical protein
MTAANNRDEKAPDHQTEQRVPAAEEPHTADQELANAPITPPDRGADDPPPRMDARERVEGLLRAAATGIDPQVLITIHRKNLGTIVGRREFPAIRAAIANGWVDKVASWPDHTLSAACTAAGARAHRALVAALGTSAAHPTLDELRSAVRSVQSTIADSEIIAALAAVAWIDVPATPHALVLLDEDFALAPQPRSAAAPTARAVLPPAARPSSNPSRAATKAAKRKATAEANAKAAEIAEAEAAKRRTAKIDPGAAGAVPEAPPTFAGRGARPAVDRRPAKLTPKEAQIFSTEDPLVGTIVEVDVRYHFQDPAEPDVRSKFRPAVIVAVSDERFLVRGLYSLPKEWTAAVTRWHRFGLNSECGNVSMVNEETVSRDVGLTFGRLSDEAWNLLW